MILNVTEEQKKLIESQSYMVVEFKLRCKKLYERLEEILQRAIDGEREAILFLQDMAFRTFDSLRELEGWLLEKYKPYIEDLIPKLDFDYEPHRKYPFVRTLGRKYQPNFSYKVIYHRCRDRC